MIAQQMAITLFSPITHLLLNRSIYIDIPHKPGILFGVISIFIYKNDEGHMLSLHILLLLEGFSFIVLFGVVSLLKREGLSRRFAIEGGIFTLVVSGLTALTGFQTHPVLFLILIYLFTMRVRFLV